MHTVTVVVLVAALTGVGVSSKIYAQSPHNAYPIETEYSLAWKPPASLLFESRYLSIALMPHITIGSAVQAIGASTAVDVSLPEVLILENLSFYLQASYFYSFNNLGIPGSSHTGFFSGALVISVGEEGSLKNGVVPLGTHAHNIIYQYEYFLDTLGTSQPLGLIGYYYSQPTWLVGIVAENDAFALMRQDKFRTAGVEITTLFAIDNRLWGLALGTRLWTSATSGAYAPTNHRGEEVGLEGQYGHPHRHGILYAAAYHYPFKLSIGIDSEEIRTLFQNAMHFFLNYSPFSAIDTEPRLYVQLEIYPRFSLY